MTLRKKLLTGVVVLTSAAGGAALATEPAARKAEPLPQHQVPTSKDGNLVVGLCDGETSMEVKGVKEGGKMSRDQALAVTGALMTEWRRKNPRANWDDVAPPPQVLAQAPKPPPSPDPKAPRSPPALPTTPQKPGAGGAVGTAGQNAASGASQAAKDSNLQTGHTYGAFSNRDEQVWAASTQAFVEEGNRVFHDAEAVGGTIAVSCDMCHPDAANTHPETYPKYQVQLGRVAMLRDMINWCIQNPVRGKPLADDDPKMKAMEAYIYAKRKGVALDFGKH
ncbi:c-type cytochrome [Hyalangium rubrum]|uniref:Cytochrome C n=1 Tax=Hyalangium rubrum TaxID=3103134 RepID=A0ABU5H2Y4_9BACT|nr:cytochrome C [Hyalangium sp. s54d21]MDY7227825.1 cytochrome C [Hyalangium sp. s54d21]